MSMRAVGTSEKIGAQCRCTTGGKAQKDPQLVLAELEQMQQSGEESAQDGPNVKRSWALSVLLSTKGQSASISVRRARIGQSDRFSPD